MGGKITLRKRPVGAVFCFCGAFIILVDILSQSTGVVQCSLPNLAFSSCEQSGSESYHSPVTTSPAGPNAKSTQSAKNKHSQVCSTWSAGGCSF